MVFFAWVVLAAAPQVIDAREHEGPPPPATSLPPNVEHPSWGASGRGVPVDTHFISYHGTDDYEVTVQDQTCRTPCTLQLKPGPTKLSALGPGELETQLVIPHLPSQVRLAHWAPRWYTPAGAVMVPLGLVIGASMWAVGFACGFRNDGCLIANIVAWPIFGVTMTVIGAILLGLGNKSAPLDANRAEILDF